MEIIKIENLNFAYPNTENDILKNINLTVNQGEFITVCGRSGCGKTTLLRSLKSVLAPVGKGNGKIYFNGKELSKVTEREQSEKIGFVMQSPQRQLVSEFVWHEMAFGLENLGCDNTQIRARVAEMASFFGIEKWFGKKTNELSGGQKQILNLASVMVMNPDILILDEPLSQLDAIASREFIRMLRRVNLELGTSVILAEHRLEDAVAVSDRVIVMEKGEIIAEGNARECADKLKNNKNDMYYAFPTPIRVYTAVENGDRCPVSVRQGRDWLKAYAEGKELEFKGQPDTQIQQRETAIELKEVYFRYEKELPDVIKGMSLKINKGEIFAVTGGNGSGKTTLLSILSGINRPYTGKVLINGTPIKKVHNLYNGVIGYLPQEPLSLFLQKSVYLDLYHVLNKRGLTEEEKEKKLLAAAKMCKIEGKLNSHPSDLSGGEAQRAALAKLILLSPEIILMDEPTKGMDAGFKREFAHILSSLKRNGATIVIVSHDIEFCAEYADRCTLFFDGDATATGQARDFFTANSFYTTAANRMAKLILPKAVLAEDIISACGAAVEKYEGVEIPNEVYTPKTETENIVEVKEKKKLTAGKIIAALVFFALFIFTMLLINKGDYAQYSIHLQIVSVVLLFVSLVCIVPKRQSTIDVTAEPPTERKLKKRTIIASLLVIIFIPLTMLIGTFYLQNKKYYFTSLLIILQTMLPFFIAFEDKKPQTRQIVVISVMCALAVAGRTAFFAFPQFKPVLSIVIITGVCLGAETGFLAGAIAGFVSNFFFGQGAWTPWQMFALGITGFIAGVLFSKCGVKKTKLSLCIYGGFAALVLHGVIMNVASVLTWQDNPTLEMVVSSCVLGLPFDLVHSVSTIFFMWFISEPVIEKLERVKEKYGIYT